MAETKPQWNRQDALHVRSVLERIGFCGCGSEAGWEVMLELLTEAEKHSARGFYRDKWYEFGAKVLDAFDLTEHGTGIGWAWLTDDGKILLRFLRDFGLESHCFNDGSGHPEWSAEFSWTATPKEGDSFDEWQRSLTTVGGNAE